MRLATEIEFAKGFYLFSACHVSQLQCDYSDEGVRLPIPLKATLYRMQQFNTPISAPCVIPPDLPPPQFFFRISENFTPPKTRHREKISQAPEITPSHPRSPGSLHPFLLVYAAF